MGIAYLNRLVGGQGPHAIGNDAVFLPISPANDIAGPHGRETFFMIAIIVRI